MEENVIQINGGTTIILNVSVKSIIYVKKIIFGILLHAVEKWKCLASFIDNSVIRCDETIEETKTVPLNFNEKKDNL